MPILFTKSSRAKNIMKLYGDRIRAAVDAEVNRKDLSSVGGLRDLRSDMPERVAGWRRESYLNMFVAIAPTSGIGLMSEFLATSVSKTNIAIAAMKIRDYNFSMSIQKSFELAKQAHPLTASVDAITKVAMLPTIEVFFAASAVAFGFVVAEHIESNSSKLFRKSDLALTDKVLRREAEKAGVDYDRAVGINNDRGAQRSSDAYDEPSPSMG